MPTTAIAKSTFDFLKTLEQNNNRDWFNANKDRYLAEHAKVLEIAAQLITEVGKFDMIEPTTPKKTLFRIYRDTRFSKNKTPYKNHFSGSLTRATAYRRGGFYFHLEPHNKSMIAGGFWAPSSPDLKRMRAEIAVDADNVRKIITSPEFVETFGELRGDQVKTAPKGYKKEHPAIDLLRYKQYLLVREFSDKEVQQEGFVQKAANTFQRMLPFFDYMSAVLTTDENGVPLPGLE